MPVLLTSFEWRLFPFQLLVSDKEIFITNMVN
ncbi:hypothetical protein swp_0972 [Shewanella piezotolerans WP3]|uniref:Uncharacterized protein n=1 Tax=Shewanella piezotolerans (strain WP3 / JCM 13877) TaxID=225849 RepID=B8CK73_SHEPW|nr:hypothetical protein swp_0972 [Shewanella piezotolerans WP3]